MKKKILFMLINMNVGGTEKALLNMINEIPKEEYDITVLMLEKYGGFLNSIPSHVHIEYLTGYKDIKYILNQPPHLTAVNFLKSGKVIKSMSMLLFFLLSKILKERSLFFKYLLKGYQGNEIEYDLAVAYAGPMDFISFFVINKIKAKKKVQWIHFDVNKIGFNERFAAKIYKKFDRIFVVSNQGKDKLVSKLPFLKEKTDTFFNLISPNAIDKMAKEGIGFEDKFKGVRILTVGRLTKEKGQDLTIPVLAKLKNSGYNVRWYCIGDGGARKEYEDLINKNNIVNDFILLGANTNPYPFMQQCNIYVQPSRHEGYCITLSEAKYLNKPIISTNFTGANEQITNNKTGLIIKFDEIEMYNSVKKLLDDKKLRENIIKDSRYEIISPTKEIEKFLDIVNSNN
ncbi:glycosyl transferase [Bacillus sp. AFS073361]|uniref:glycosyltransferase n=1 Tax=Bacillus sp. AFS073361 TaxID=2033511 RepID=UPI000BF8C6D1|nr:glycosyltransferase [Bacillus sp. AFS073361]PFP29588.1 glycosyl transferase [Bacillus sp. AFS073361]